MQEKIRLLNEGTAQFFDRAISWALLFLLVLAAWSAIMWTARALLRRIDAKLYQQTCPHRWISVRIYRRPAKRFFRKQVHHPCIKCGAVKPVDEVKAL